MERKITVFSSFDEENAAETARRREMTSEQRMEEMGVLMARRWGEDWWKKPMEKIVSWERVDW